MVRVFKACDECDGRIKKHHMYKGKLLCGKCYKKKFNILGCGAPTKNIEDVLSKIYEGRMYCRKDGYWNNCVFNLPQVMHGRKFKIVLVDE